MELHSMSGCTEIPTIFLAKNEDNVVGTAYLEWVEHKIIQFQGQPETLITFDYRS